MNEINYSYPIADLHCDMLEYLCSIENASPDNKEDIGCAVPYLLKGNVKFQVMAIYTGVEKDSPQKLIRQAEIFQKLITLHKKLFNHVCNAADAFKILNTKKIGILLSIENASGLCNEDEPIQQAFLRFEYLEKWFKSVFYISLTHHGENRFGGGNYTKTGLKEDGKELLNFLNEKKIAIDLSHTSDALAYDIINHIDGHNLTLPIIASHSNFRPISEHVRNLPDELAAEIIRRQGLIGINFLRAFVHPDKPEKLLENILHGLQSAASNALCFGADFFYTKNHPDPDRQPFYFSEHENAEKYQGILRSLNKFLSKEEISAIAYKNVINFIRRLNGND
jgi:microsomal dipeptidase-like Zn-dependent dipeptidase